MAFRTRRRNLFLMGRMVPNYQPAPELSQRRYAAFWKVELSLREVFANTNQNRARCVGVLSQCNASLIPGGEVRRTRKSRRVRVNQAKLHSTGGTGGCVCCSHCSRRKKNQDSKRLVPYIRQFGIFLSVVPFLRRTRTNERNADGSAFSPGREPFPFSIRTNVIVPSCHGLTKYVARCLTWTNFLKDVCGTLMPFFAPVIR